MEGILAAFVKGLFEVIPVIEVGLGVLVGLA
jgi:hypothetical protein